MLEPIVVFSFVTAALAIVCALAIIGLIVVILMIPSVIARLISLPRRRVLLRTFVSSVRDGQARAKFRSQKAVFGKGVDHAFVGTAGTIRFRLVRSIRSFREEDLYCLEIANGRGLGDEGSDSYLFYLTTEGSKPHPIVECYFILKERCLRSDYSSEAEAS